MAKDRADNLTLFVGSNCGSFAPPAAIRPGRAAARVVRSLPLARRRQGRDLYVHLRAARTIPPDKDAPGSIEPWHAVTAVRPDTAHVRALRFLDGTGEALAALALVFDGIALIGLATLA